MRQDRQSLQTDPIGYEDDLNLYSYVRNDPLNAIDRSGRDVVVLNTGIWWTGNNADHQAFLVGSDESGRWEYRSLAGVEGGFSITGNGPADYRAQPFEGNLADILQTGVLAEYENAYFRDSTPEQDRQVLQAADAFRRDHETYNLQNCNCGDYTFAAVSQIDPNFPNEVNPADTKPYLEDEQNGWAQIRHPPPLIPGLEELHQ